jgi:hypothetical protein
MSFEDHLAGTCVATEVFMAEASLSKRIPNIDDFAELVEFDQASLVHPGGNCFFLVVTGLKPAINMQVILTPIPRTDHEELDYWPYYVIGYYSHRWLSNGNAYCATAEIDQAGSMGIEIVGLNRRERLRLAPEDVEPEIGEGTALRFCDPKNAPPAQGDR